jgi:hypothetical protein
MTGPARPLMGKDKTSNRQIGKQAKEGNMLAGEKDGKHSVKVSGKLKEYLKAKRNSSFKERILAKKGGRTWYAEKNKNSWE